MLIGRPGREQGFPAVVSAVNGWGGPSAEPPSRDQIVLRIDWVSSAAPRIPWAVLFSVAPCVSPTVCLHQPVTVTVDVPMDTVRTPEGLCYGTVPVSCARIRGRQAAGERCRWLRLGRDAAI